MAAFIGCKATTMKVLIHAPGDGFQAMKLLVWFSLDITGIARNNSLVFEQVSEYIRGIKSASAINEGAFY